MRRGGVKAQGVAEMVTLTRYPLESRQRRFAHQVEATYANRLVDSPVRGKLTWNNIGLALVLAFNIVRHIGLRAAIAAGVPMPLQSSYSALTGFHAKA